MRSFPLRGTLSRADARGGGGRRSRRTHRLAARGSATATSRGNVLAGGVGYFAFFSIFPAVLLAFTVFGVLLRNQPQLLEEAKDAINELLPGFVKTRGQPEGIINVEAPTGAALSMAGVLSVVGLVLAGTGWLGALRDGIRAIFGVEGAPGNAVLAKLRDLGVLVLLGVGIAGLGARRSGRGDGGHVGGRPRRARRPGLGPDGIGARRGRRCSTVPS